MSLECGEICKAANGLALGMTLTSAPKMVNLPIFVLHALSQVTICQTIGSLTQDSMLLCQCFTSSMNTPVNPRWLYQCSFVVDGNFHGDHMKMRRPDDDVELADGLGFVVEDKPYRTHLSESKEIKQVWLYQI
jgi:hypothetical protein